MPRKKNTTPLKAVRAFQYNGRVYRRGQVVDPSDPVVKGRDRLFTPVEQATAAPGEVRNVKPPVKEEAPEPEVKPEAEEAEAGDEEE